jgi:trimeric autotransporter adhesin
VGRNLYVTGDFTDLGGNPIAGQVARWDGAYWHALGSGLSSTIRSLAVSGPNLYAGG